MWLGISKEEFGFLTPALFAELIDQQQKRQREMQVALALLRMDIINFSMARPKQPIQLEDLLPSAAREGRAKRKRMTPKRRAAVAEQIRAVMGSWPGGLIVENPGVVD